MENLKFSPEIQLNSMQNAIQEFGFDGWLLYDFRGLNVLALRVLGISESEMGSRRFFYFIPAQGDPVKLVHRIESTALDHLLGKKIVYLTSPGSMRERLNWCAVSVPR